MNDSYWRSSSSRSHHWRTFAAGSPKARWSARNRSAYASSSSRRSVSAVVSCGWAGTDPTPGRHHAEAQPGQLGSQHVPPVPFRLGHGEDREHPPVGGGGPAPPEDPRVTLAQDGQRLGGQLVAGRAVVAPRLQDAAPFQPGYGRTDGWLV